MRMERARTEHLPALDSERRLLSGAQGLLPGVFHDTVTTNAYRSAGAALPGLLRAVPVRSSRANRLGEFSPASCAA